MQLMKQPGYLARLSVGGKVEGSAILVRPDVLLTCWHVLKQAGDRQKIKIEINGVEFSVVCPAAQRDQQSDLALLRIPPLEGVEIPTLSDSDATGTRCEYFAFPNGNFGWGEAEIRGPHIWHFEINLSYTHGCSGGAVVRRRNGDPQYVGLISQGEALYSTAKNKAAIEAFLGAQGVLPAGPNYPPHYDPGPYLESLRGDTRWIELRELGVDLKDAKTEPGMDALYHPLMTVRAHTTDGKTKKTHKRKRTIAPGTEPPGPIRLEQALDNPRLIIEGGPGSGKTTFLRRIAWALCRDDHANETLKLPCDGFPLWIRIRDLDQHITTARDSKQQRPDPAHPDWITRFLGSGPWNLPASFFKAKLADPKSVLLIDGLDEASNSDRREEIARMIASAATTCKCRFVVTTRPAALEAASALPQFQTVLVADWDRTEIEAFCRRWSTWLKGGAESGETYARGLIEAVSATERRLRANPLMLTALAVIYGEAAELPDERAKLYEAIMRWLGKKASQRSQGSQGSQGDAAAAEGYSREECLTRLGRLALEMQEWNSSGQTLRAGIDDAARRIALEFRKVPEEGRFEAARAFLERAQVESGIVTLRSRDLEFWHRSFQEYLAARRLKDLRDEELLPTAGRFLCSREGREVLPLAAGCLIEGGPERLDGLLEELITDAEGRKSLRERAHAVGVLGAMLADTRKSYQLNRPASLRWGQLLDSITGIFDVEKFRQTLLEDRVGAADALAAVRDPRLHRPWEEKYWVEIPAGTFRMGSENDDEGFEDEKPRTVALQGFYIGKFPVTVWEYQQYLADEELQGPEDWPGDWNEQLEHRSRPVVSVTWHQAIAYCRWASRKWLVNLPSEEQWEYAARGRDSDRYPWGPESPTPEYANYDDTKQRATTPVGLFPLGDVTRWDRRISDMAGNVWEWTRSDYDKATKVVRGASFIFGARNLRAACRFRNVSVYGNFYVGFRCVREDPVP